MSACRVVKHLALVLVVSACSPTAGWAMQKDQSKPDLKSYRIDGQRVTEEPVQIDG